MTTSSGPTLLLILDGWGYSDNEKHNAISQANTPVWDQLLQQYPHTLIQTSGLKVGSAGRTDGQFRSRAHEPGRRPGGLPESHTHRQGYRRW